MGKLGVNKSQVNLYSKDEKYTLNTTATNYDGESTDSILISLGCSEELEDETIILNEGREISLRSSRIKDY